jgi:hypothetical protein
MDISATWREEARGMVKYGINLLQSEERDFSKWALKSK